MSSVPGPQDPNIQSSSEELVGRLPPLPPTGFGQGELPFPRSDDGPVTVASLGRRALWLGAPERANEYAALLWGMGPFPLSGHLLVLRPMSVVSKSGYAQLEICCRMPEHHDRALVVRFHTPIDERFFTGKAAGPETETHLVAVYEWHPTSRPREHSADFQVGVRIDHALLDAIEVLGSQPKDRESHRQLQKLLRINRAVAGFTSDDPARALLDARFGWISNDVVLLLRLLHAGKAEEVKKRYGIELTPTQSPDFLRARDTILRAIHFPLAGFTKDGLDARLREIQGDSGSTRLNATVLQEIELVIPDGDTVGALLKLVDFAANKGGEKVAQWRAMQELSSQPIGGISSQAISRVGDQLLAALSNPAQVVGNQALMEFMKIAPLLSHRHGARVATILAKRASSKKAVYDGYRALCLIAPHESIGISREMVHDVELRENSPHAHKAWEEIVRARRRFLPSEPWEHRSSQDLAHGDERSQQSTGTKVASLRQASEEMQRRITSAPGLQSETRDWLCDELARVESRRLENQGDWFQLSVFMQELWEAVPQLEAGESAVKRYLQALLDAYRAQVVMGSAKDAAFIGEPPFPSLGNASGAVFRKLTRENDRAIAALALMQPVLDRMSDRELKSSLLVLSTMLERAYSRFEVAKQLDKVLGKLTVVARDVRDSDDRFTNSWRECVAGFVVAARAFAQWPDLIAERREKVAELVSFGGQIASSIQRLCVVHPFSMLPDEIHESRDYPLPLYMLRERLFQLRRLFDTFSGPWCEPSKREIEVSSLDGGLNLTMSKETVTSLIPSHLLRAEEMGLGTISLHWWVDWSPVPFRPRDTRVERARKQQVYSLVIDARFAYTLEGKRSLRAAGIPIAADEVVVGYFRLSSSWFQSFEGRRLRSARTRILIRDHYVGQVIDDIAAFLCADVTRRVTRSAHAVRARHPEITNSDLDRVCVEHANAARKVAQELIRDISAGLRDPKLPTSRHFEEEVRAVVQRKRSEMGRRPTEALDYLDREVVWKRREGADVEFLQRGRDRVADTWGDLQNSLIASPEFFPDANYRSPFGSGEGVGAIQADQRLIQRLALRRALETVEDRSEGLVTAINLIRRSLRRTDSAAGFVEYITRELGDQPGGLSEKVDCRNLLPSKENIAKALQPGFVLSGEMPLETLEQELKSWYAEFSVDGQFNDTLAIHLRKRFKEVGPYSLPVIDDLLTQLEQLNGESRGNVPWGASEGWAPPGDFLDSSQQA